jgi:spermidine/putrescine transport system ATP-binding protein
LSVSSNSTAIEAKDIVKQFGIGANAMRALDGVSVTIKQNEFFTLLGPSGCGKTTLLRMIAGFEFPTSGAILLDGVEIGALPPFKRPVNTVFQSYALFPHMSVAENIGFGLEMLGKSKTEISARVDAMLALVKMTAMKDRRTDQISGGQAQRVALARALLLDEPLSALDYKLRKEMQIELKRMQAETGITFVFVTHDQEEALTMSDRIAVMSAGKILQIGSPHDIYDRPASRFVASFIGETNFLKGVVAKASGQTCTVTAGGISFQVASQTPQNVGANVTLAIRPEHCQIVKGHQKNALKGTLKHIVYSGTDTQYHVTLPSDETVLARAQNRVGHPAEFAVGDAVSVIVQAGAAQVLAD